MTLTIERLLELVGLINHMRKEDGRDVRAALGELAAIRKATEAMPSAERVASKIPSDEEGISEADACTALRTRDEAWAAKLAASEEARKALVDALAREHEEILNLRKALGEARGATERANEGAAKARAERDDAKARATALYEALHKAEKPPADEVVQRWYHEYLTTADGRVAAEKLAKKAEADRDAVSINAEARIDEVLGRLLKMDHELVATRTRAYSAEAERDALRAAVAPVSVWLNSLGALPLEWWDCANIKKLAAHHGVALAMPTPTASENA